MNISEVSQQLSNLLNKASSLFLSATDDFASNLSMGQTIKGKVLRSYDNGRYLVDFSGHEKVVDSSVPLRTGELIQGRVIGIGEKVELKRLPVVTDVKSESILSDLQGRGFLGNKWEALLRDCMLKYQIKLSAEEKNLIVNMLKNSPVPEHAMLAAVAMLKQGLPISEQIMQLLSELQAKDRNLRLYPSSQNVPVLTINDANVAVQPADALSNFAQVITSLLQEQQDAVNNGKNMLDGDADAEFFGETGQDARHSKHEQAFTFNWHLLNTQINGSVSHRVSTLPMWLGNKLVEINIAIYEQHDKGAKQESIQFKRLVFSLDLDFLGKIEIESIIENKNIRLRVSTEKQISTEWLVEYASFLKNDLVAYGWKLDEISYLTKNRDEMGDIVGSVMQHYVSQDSLNRVM